MSRLADWKSAQSDQDEHSRELRRARAAVTQLGPGGYGMDLLKSAASGARSGLESTAGMFGDLGGLLSRATEKLGLDPRIAKYTSPLSLMPTSEDVGAATDWMFGGGDWTRHKPLSPGGEQVAGAANFGAGMLGGPETAGKGLAMAVLPAAGREALAGLRAAGTEGVKAAEPLAAGRISQRFPTGKTATENPLTENLLINANVLKAEPAKAQQAADIVSTYPGFSGTKGLQEMSANEQLDAFTNFAKENVLHLWDLMPPDARERAQRWYLGANRIANERAAETGFHPYSVAGAYAALSPQMDWFKNVYQGDVVSRLLAEDPRIGDNLIGAGMQMWEDDPGIKLLLRDISGRRLSEMSPQEAALAIRLHDEVLGRRNYNIITPEGDYSSLMTTKSGQPAVPAWGTFGNIAKAVEALRANGDVDLLSPLMGMKHKVRDFYNNIVAPIEGQPFGDITADTHQIAASLFRPLSGSSPEVQQGLMSGSKGVATPPKSAITGLQGLYPLYADATRMAAAERGVPVRAMQSVPWEAVRSLFPDTLKRGKTPATIDEIWQAAGRGEITAADARQAIIQAAGGFRVPTW